MLTIREMKFRLGKIVATPGALQVLHDSGDSPWLKRLALVEPDAVRQFDGKGGGK